VRGKGKRVEEWIERLFGAPAMTGWGHFQRVADKNLGLGWIYYALARVLRPATAVVIGSYRGFVPLVLGKALQDNGGGEVIFVDPSLVDDFWKDPTAVVRISRASASATSGISWRRRSNSSSARTTLG
jgi:hypothetical protein